MPRGTVGGRQTVNQRLRRWKGAEVVVGNGEEMEVNDDDDNK